MTEAARTRVRYVILAMLFVVTTVNYADRASISIAGVSIQKALGIDAVGLGYIFSAFGWSYVLGQIPGGWLLDRFGSKWVYGVSIAAWSVFTLLQGFAAEIGIASAATTLFFLRLMMGAAEAPSFPGNARIVAAWFPARERGFASAVFNSAQYFATVLFAPFMGWLTFAFGWRYVFVVMGSLGLGLAVLWMIVIHAPREHPWANESEVRFIEENGGLVDIDAEARAGAPGDASTWSRLAQMLTNRMLIGVYLGQYCINALTYFFLTWFPVYLVQERGMSILKAGFVASLPAACGFAGGLLGGLVSDQLLRRGHSLSVSRKGPIIAGLLLSTTIVLCNYVRSEALVVALMAIAFLGKGFGALGWAVVSDTSPRQIAGLSGALFNTFGNLASITTPIVVGYIIEATGSFRWALVYVAANAVVAIFSYLVIVGPIERVVLPGPASEPIPARNQS